MTTKIPLHKPYFDSEELEEIKGVLDSGWVTQGNKSKELESGISEYLGTKYAVSVSNCTSALHLALLSIGIKAGDEVIVPDYTFPATANAILYCGARPVFADIDIKTYNIDPKAASERITSKTKAIVPVHAFGQPAAMDALKEIADRYNLRIIEDAACALGAKYKNKYAGTMGDIGCFSFHGRKGITTGEGGIVVTDDKGLAARIRSLANFGMKLTTLERKGHKRFSMADFSSIGYNYKMSDIAAAVGVAQLRKLDKIIRRKEALARHWGLKLSAIKGITAPYKERHVRHVFQSYVPLVDKGIDRDRVIQHLRDKGVEAHIGTYALHAMPIYKSGQACKNSLQIFRRAIALPIYYVLKEKEIDYIVGLVKAIIKDV